MSSLWKTITMMIIVIFINEITIIIIVIVFHNDDIDENHENHQHDCLSKLSVLGPCECLLGRVGRATSTEHLVQLLAHSDKRRPLAHLLELSSSDVGAS